MLRFDQEALSDDRGSFRDFAAADKPDLESLLLISPIPYLTKPFTRHQTRAELLCLSCLCGPHIAS